MTWRGSGGARGKPAGDGRKDTGLLVHLDGGQVPLEADDLAHQLGVAHAHQLVHGCPHHAAGRDHCRDRRGCDEPPRRARRAPHPSLCLPAPSSQTPAHAPLG